MSRESTDTLVSNKETTNEKSLWNVVFHNDNRTSFEIVIEILLRIFNKQYAESVFLTNKVHTEGRAVVAQFDFEIAEQKAHEGMSMARQYGYPLKITIEKN